MECSFCIWLASLLNDVGCVITWVMWVRGYVGCVGQNFTWVVWVVWINILRGLRG